MSLHSAAALGGHEDAGSAGRAQKVPLLRPGGGCDYSVWSPEMEAYMMSQKIGERDYKVELPWGELVATVDGATARAELEAMQRLLKGVKSEHKPESKEEQERERDTKVVAAMVERSKKAYGILYSALDADLRALYDAVPRGYAFGLWSRLKKKFEDDGDANIADVWLRYMTLEQTPDEQFDAYMARVDKVEALLEAAKQKPHAGQRKVTLLYRLQPMYETARATLVAQRLIMNDDSTIDWAKIKTFMQDYEREKTRGEGATSSSSAERTYAARVMNASSRPAQAQGG